ncbi:50S ribosomal protein L4 [Alkalispirochaeta sphaeroplastigenens]|uniref:Large ribosomal subunit protein uL4 n=1 Tax=Alkalispirochaeta sphaeroplastigenens TaxID=1187066 RepID=A0A2S4JGS8_9SPIO|nr:50S ribosomal protein L4 [Alkalispirochaeta sphaeroplastigenens]POQ98758.1 50S ribosomal protein L4 [Alkalispirochaeta sphaeroplastigenens]
MDVQVVSTAGKELRTLSVSERVFSRDVSDGAIYHAIRNELANKRVGTASTKTRGFVNFGGRKPWRQKGTGRARAGSRRSPVWVGGGTVFGPLPRDYSYRLPKKMKRAAMMSILSQQMQNGNLLVVEDFSVESGKTKDMAALLRNLTDAQRVVLVTASDDPMVKRSARNIPWLRFLSWNRLRAHDLFYAHKVVMMESAATALGDFYATPGEEQE